MSVREAWETPVLMTLVTADEVRGGKYPFAAEAEPDKYYASTN